MLMKVLQKITLIIVTSMHEANTLNVLPLVTIGWTLVTVTTILHKAL